MDCELVIPAAPGVADVFVTGPELIYASGDGKLTMPPLFEVQLYP